MSKINPPRPSKKQLAILRFITEFYQMHSHAPSYREIARAFGFNSVASVSRHIDRLVDANLLRRSPRAARSLEPIEQNPHPETKSLFRAQIRALSKIDDPRAKRQIEILKLAATILDLKL